MTPIQQKEFRRYTDAMKVDILSHMSGDDLGVPELRRIQKVAKGMIDFLNSYGTFSEREARGDLLRDSADGVAPSIHESLMSETFDGNAALKSLMTRMLDQYADLELDRVDIADALASLPQERRESIAKRLGLPSVGEHIAELESDAGGGEKKP